jgi:hypothetical protein
MSFSCQNCTWHWTRSLDNCRKQAITRFEPTGWVMSEMENLSRFDSYFRLGHETDLRLLRIDVVGSVHPNVQPHPLTRFCIEPKHGRWTIHAGWSRVGVHGPILGNGVSDKEESRLVGGILHDVFLLGNLDKETGSLTASDLLLDMAG